eukprot:4579826-Pyramimonas_sp.AAC.1
MWPPKASARIPRKPGAIGPGETCPPRSNDMFQADARSCGLWASRWIERALREIPGEGRRAPASIGAMFARGR